MWLAEDGPELANPDLVGHKFARQTVLARRGFRVPPLVCIPATVFDKVVTPEIAGQLPHRAQQTADLAGLAVDLRARVRKTALPEQLRRAVLDGFGEVAGPDGLVAVRACVVADPAGSGLGEDSAADPFAGLSDTFLYVHSGNVIDRVAACWASAFNPEAVVYRAKRGLDPFTARVAVGIQRMVLGSRSFVVFTRDPRDGAARSVIAAAYGIGEGVVQEKADVDHFFLEHASQRWEASIAVKTRSVGWDPERASEGVVELPVQGTRSTQPVLTDEELTQVAAVASSIEEVFAEPQDIEGTITDDGLIHVLQARPVVAVPPGAGVQSAAGAQPAAPVALIGWSNSNITESFPGMSCPLTFSVARDLYELGFADLYRRMGVPDRVLRLQRHRLRRMVGYLDGRIYYRLDSWYYLHAQMRCFRPLLPTWEQAMGLNGTAQPGSTAQPTSTAQPGKAAGRDSRLGTVLHVAEMLARLVPHPVRARRFLRWWDEYHRRLADVSALRPHEVVDAYRELWAEVGERWGVTLVNNLFLASVTWVINGLLRRWLPEVNRGLLNGMLCGGRENRSAAAMRSAISLAEAAAGSAQVRAVVTADTDPRERWQQLTSAGDAAFVTALHEHIRRYGDRGLNDLKLEAVTPRQEPWTLLDNLRSYLSQGLTVQASRQGEAQLRRHAELELRDRCRNPAKRIVLSWLYGSLRAFLRVREDTRFCRTELLGDSRALLTRMGAELAARNRLDRPADVLDLTVDEVLGAFEGTVPGADLRGLAALRAAERAAWTGFAWPERHPTALARPERHPTALARPERHPTAGPSLPPRLWTDPDLPVTTALRSARGTTGIAATGGAAGSGGSGGTLTGLGSSPGIARGRAKVVLDPSVSADQCRDRILVARETDPGWLFLMLSAKALIVERGTLLSHTAVTGRLLGIPTVVAVAGATTLIADGSLLEVDGTAGTVSVLNGAP